MGTFTVLNKKSTYKNPTTNKIATVVKVVKDGTKRTFFSVKNSDDKFITRTMFARELDAIKLAKHFCNN